MTITIIGGTDGLGKWFARYLKNKGYDVIVTGRDKVKGKNVEKEIGVKYISDNIEGTKMGDVVIVAVPINVSEKVIREIGPYVKENGLFMDITSIKEIPAKAMEESVREGVCVIPTHPMFGPSIPSLKRQVVILTPSEKHKNNPWFRKVLDFLNNEGAKVIITSPMEHDKIMGVVQGLTHYAYISLGITLKDLNIDIKKSREYASPIYELMINIIGRIIGQNPYLYADIQMHNPQIKHIHETFIKECETIKDIVNRKDREGFVKLMKDAARHFGNETVRGLNYSDKAVNAISAELEKIKKSIGREVGFRHVHSNNVHYGIVKDVLGDYVILDKNGKELKINIGNVNIMDDEELNEWKNKNLKKYNYDISFLFKKDVDENIILKLLKGRFNVDIIDVYSGSNIPENYKSITFRITDYDKDKLEKIKDEFIYVVKNIGGTVRYGK